MKNSFLPIPTRIESIETVAPDHRLFTFLPESPLALVPGQFCEVSLAGVGAFPVSACALPREGRVISCIRRAGRVTDALFGCAAGDEIGLRGPFGNGFPIADFAGKDVLLVAGGLGMAPLRALLQALLVDDDRKITLLYGAREPAELLFHDELQALAATGRIDLRLSVDFAEELPPPAAGTVCRIGLVTELLHEIAFAPSATVAALCGPPAMYRCLLDVLAAAGIPPRFIFATLERRMRCGVGQCCHCVTGGIYLCLDGPVFSLEQLRTMEGAV